MEKTTVKITRKDQKWLDPKELEEIYDLVDDLNDKYEISLFLCVFMRFYGS